MKNLCRTLGLASVVLAIGCGDSTADSNSGNASDSASETTDSSGNSDSDSDSASGSESASDSDSTDTDPATATESETDSETETETDSETETATGDGDGDTGDGDGDTGDGDGDSGTDTETDTDTDTDSDTDSDTDTTTGNDTNGVPDYCEKVDFLFVIDNSISMLPEQDALKAAFPGFIDSIEQNLDTDDHILITDTDTVGWCAPWNCQGDPGNLHETCEGPNGYACSMDPVECDLTLGAGIVEPAGQEASNEFCDPFGGNRYILEDDPDKPATFSCMASVGLAGNPLERPMDAITQALSPQLNGEGGCNDGFLRDDAILVITFISDDDGQEDTLSPQQVFDAVLEAKGNDLDRIVTLGLIPSPNNNCSFTDGAGEHWLEFIQMFGENGLDGPSCADDYVEFFQGAVDVIVQACAANPM